MVSVGLSIGEYGGYVVVALDGELDVGDAASVVDALTSVAARDPRIIVDLAALEFIDCRALGVLCRVRAQARQAGGDLLLAAPRGHRVMAGVGADQGAHALSPASFAASAAGVPLKTNTPGAK